MLDFYFDWVVLGLSALFTFGVIEILFNKLTPNTIPERLSNFFTRILWTARGAAIAFYAAIAIAKIFLDL